MTLEIELAKTAPMNKKDYDDLLKLCLGERKEVERSDPMYWAKHYSSRWSEDEHRIIYLARQDNRPVGYSISWLNCASSLDLDLIYVEPEFRNQGIGTKLLEAQVEVARKGKKFLSTSVFANNKPSIAMCRKLGFKFSEQHIDEDNKKYYFISLKFSEERKIVAEENKPIAGYFSNLLRIFSWKS